MIKLFYSFDDGTLYHIDEHCELDTLMHEQFTQNGVLIYAEKDKLELVEYNDGREVEFDTRFLVALDDGTAVLRKTRNADRKPKTVRGVFLSTDNFFDFIDNMTEGE